MAPTTIKPTFIIKTTFLVDLVFWLQTLWKDVEHGKEFALVDEIRRRIRRLNPNAEAAPRRSR